MTKHGFHDATRDSAKIREWWTKRPGALVGVATGQASGLYVVDLDVKGPANGLDEWHEIVKRLGAALEETALVETPSGGMHVYYSVNGSGPTPALGNTAGRLAPGIDTRGDGGYVIAAGSPGYEYVDGHGPERIAPLPGALRALLTAAKDASAPAGPVGPEIPAGQRNSTLISLAGTMRRRGLGEKAIYAALSATNRESCKPPLDDAEVRGIAESAAGYAPKEDLATGRVDIAEASASGEPGEDKATTTSTVGRADVYTERGNARRFAQREGGRVAWVPGGGWLAYHEGVFEDDSCILTQKVHRTVDELYAEAHLAAADDEKIGAGILKFAKASSSAAGVTNLLKLAAEEPALRRMRRQFDADPALTNSTKGVISMGENGGVQLLPHDPKYLMTKRAGCVYDAAAECPTWTAHLQLIFQGDRAAIGFLQRWAGRCLSGLAPTDNCRILLAYGTGANGKSVTVETIAAVLGSYAVSTDFSTWCTGGNEKGGEIPHPELTRLAGARLVRATESGHSHRLDESLLKLYTGGEEVTPRNLYASKPVVYRPQFSLLLSTNHLPRLEGADVGFWRRFLKLGFNYTIPDPDQDTLIMERLAGELPGVLNWMLKGYADWQTRGLDPPISVLMDTAEYRTDIDIIGRFIEERMTAVPGSSVSLADAVYPVYRSWSEGNGTKTLAANTLSQRLKEHGLTIGKDPVTRRSTVVDMELVGQEFSQLGVPL